jgi:hypothetical protein
MKRNMWILLVAVFLALWPGENSPAKNKHEDKDPDNGKSAGDKMREVLPPSEPVFTQHERVIISGWCHNGYQGLPPGLAKREQLPPGLEKHLRKRGTLPPGLQKKMVPVPIVVERQLDLLPTGYRRVIIGDNLIIMNERTALIYDVVRLVIP